MKDGEYKVANYGQWDGYPEGQGVDVLNFLHSLPDVDTFSKALEKCSFLNEEEIKQLNETRTLEGIDEDFIIEVNRDTGADILNRILNSELPVIVLATSAGVVKGSIWTNKCKCSGITSIV
jgi:glutamate mutase epsilon subunit